MKRLSTLLLILFSTVSLFAQTKIIFDTDIDTDCDDGGALAILHALADNGEVEILATIVSTHYPYSAPCVEAINRYYGRPDIPIGAPKSTWTDTGSRGSKYAHQISIENETTLNTNDDAPDAVTVYRQILAAQESNSVVILSVGYLTNIRDLLESEPDSISPLSGVELVRQKVSMWVCNGAEYRNNYNAGVWGNFTPDPTSAAIAVRDWPGTIWFCGEGRDLFTGGLLHTTPATNPVRRIYELYGVNTRPSWDPISTLFAVRSNEVFWTYRSGAYHIFNNGTFEWRSSTNENHHIAEYDTGQASQLQNTLDQLMVQPPKNRAATVEKLQVSSNNRFLMTESGTPFFPMGDTCWEIPWDLDRNEVETYLQTRKDQKFNMVGINSFDWNRSRNSTNRYGDQPFVIVGGDYDPTQPITTPGNNPGNSTEYDYWDNLEYIIDKAASKGIYVTLLPCWGNSCIVNSERIFTESTAYTYGQWIGNRFSGKTNIIWMMGGDCIPDKYSDYKPTFRKMAEGVADGVNGVNNNNGSADYSTTLMSYHGPKWSHSSSYWFPNDAFMDFNSTQDQPSDQINRITSDYGLIPVKGTWLFEGRYEGYVAADGTFGDWQCRFQAYQTVFSGGFGHLYGNMSIWEFKSDWLTALGSAGANDMQHIFTLMTSVTDSQFLSRIPDQSLLDGDTGSITGSGDMFSTCIVATRTVNGDNAMIYSANGRNVRIKMSQLTNSPMRAQWFSPRDGSYTLISTNVTSGSGAPIIEFDPPGAAANGNDYVLVLDLGSEPTSATYFTGGDLLTAGNWTRGLPNHQEAVINTNGSATMNQIDTWVSGSTVTVGGDATLTLHTDLSVFGTVSFTVSNATINCNDDLFCDNGNIILNAGSVTTANDDWEANDHAGRITVNGGTHSSGPDPDHNVGAQRPGTGIDFRGGTVTAGNFRFQAGSESSVGGGAILASASTTTTFSDHAGDIDFLSGWIGSWEVGSFGPGDWKTILTSGANITLDGTPIDNGRFDASFKVSVDGTTLSSTIPEPITFGFLGLLGLLTIRKKDLETR